MRLCLSTIISIEKTYYFNETSFKIADCCNLLELEKRYFLLLRTEKYAKKIFSYSSSFFLIYVKGDCIMFHSIVKYVFKIFDIRIKNMTYKLCNMFPIKMVDSIGRSM